MVDSFETGSGLWLVMPCLTPIRFTIAFYPDSIRNQISSMLWGLIRGLAFLHKNLVAHRDVKPDNLVIDNNRCLKIIDFDVAVRLTSEDQELESDGGTEG